MADLTFEDFAGLGGEGSGSPSSTVATPRQRPAFDSNGRKLNSRDAKLQSDLATSPEERSQEAERDITLSNIDQLETEIANVKRDNLPKKQERMATLVAEHNRIKQAANDHVASLDRGKGKPGRFQVISDAGATDTPPGQMSMDDFEQAGKPVEDEFSPGVLTKDNIKQTLFGTSAAKQEAGTIALNGLKAAGGEAAALADFVLGVPGFMVGVGAQLGGTVQAFARGEGKNSYAVGREAGQHFSEPFSNPVQKLVKLIGGEKFYENAKTTQGMSKFAETMEAAGKWVEEASGGKIARDSIPMLADTLMASMAGVKGGSEIGKPDPEMMKRLQKETDRIREKMGVEVENESAADRLLSPEEFAARAPVQEQINSVLGIRTPAEQAKVTRQRRKDFMQAVSGTGRITPEEQAVLDLRRTREYGSAEESQFTAEERLSNEEAYRKQGEGADTSVAYEPTGERPERIGQAYILRIMQKPGFERTAEDLITLRKARQEGKASPEALMLLAAGGIGAAVGAELTDDHLKGAALGGLTAGMPLAMMAALGAGGVKRSFGQAGAVKGPGGMWHPEAVERLDHALIGDKEEVRLYNWEKESGQRFEGLSDAARAFIPWSNKAIRNYLNRYAGTERDPLKSVEIPYAEGTKSWEKIWDFFAGSVSANDIREGAKQRKDIPLNFVPDARIPGEERIWNVHEAPGGPIQSYLSHVGDYLRQNVKPEELSRYDLVRAVKETAENDKRVAKQMEKASADSTKHLPVYKAYPDGFKWVELKLPEKLNEEQAKGIKEETLKEETEINDSRNDEMPSYAAKGSKVYTAVDAQGKPIKNAYTNDIARAGDPETAYLAGRLAEEGNQMGHCVGGYCEGVAAGDSQIFSLRDSKGKSHVTIEVSPTNRLVDPQIIAQHITDKAPELHGKVSKILRAADRSKDLDLLARLKSDPEIAAILERDYPLNIDQIKGKQNRAPSKEYLPYVQDFVKGGKWGEVGDLENTGLIDLEASRLKERLPDFVERAKIKFPGERYLSEAEFSKYMEEKEQQTGRRPGLGENEQGFISKELLAGLSTVGLGAVAGGYLAQDKLSGALLGALAGFALNLPGTRARLKLAADAADYGLGALSTRIGNISQPLRLRAREYERKVLTRSAELLHEVAPFMKELNRLPEKLKQELNRAILTNDKEAIAGLMKGNVALVDAWRKTRNTLNQLGEELQGHGRFKSMLGDYFPRLVKDVEGLKAALGVQERSQLDNALAKAEAASLKNRGTPLTEVEQSSIINREIQGFRRAKGYQPGFAKGRRVDEVTERLQQFYYTPSESLYAYVRGAVQDLEMAKFFGKDLAQTKVGEQQHINIETSIGNLVGREKAEGKITATQEKELINMLQSRFRGGERASSKLVQEVRNLGNMGLLGNIVSAATQLQDTATSIYAQDLRSTLTAVARQLSGREKITTADFGLADHIAEEFVSRTKTADWLNKTFKASAFTAIDRFGKNTSLNAAHSRVERLSRTAGGVAKLKAQYGETFGKDFPQLVRALRSGQITENVRALLFGELSDVQPISRLELPQGYLDNPNGRLIYMLKTFMLKQMDMMRRDVYNEFKKGTAAGVATGLKNATAYSLVLGISGATTDAVRDWLMGRNPHFEAGDVLENVLKTFAWSEFTRDKVAKGKPVEAILNAFMPPYQMIDEIIRRDPKAVRYIPILGKLYYEWELGGREAAEIRQAKKSGAELSEEAKDYRRKKREEAKARREQ